jgi:hypothetical protein
MDPFPPIAEIQDESARVIEEVAAEGVDAWIMTRGYIRPGPLERLTAHRERLKLTIAITTLDRGLQRILEPLTAPPRLRLRQIRYLRERGVTVQVAIEPLVPGLTDTRENLTALLRALADVGVCHVFTSYMFLRSGIRENVMHALAPYELGEPVVDAFTAGPRFWAGQMETAQYLPKSRRQRGYAALMAIAAGLDITVSISPASNPDFQGPVQEHQTPRAQHLLFPGFSTPRLRKRLSLPQASCSRDAKRSAPLRVAATQTIQGEETSLNSSSNRGMKP